MSWFRNPVRNPGSPDRYSTSGALALCGVCFATALYGYLLSPPSAKKMPPNVVFPSNGGPVLFPHLRHSREDGGAFECTECHHKIDADVAAADKMRCRACHYENPDVVETACVDEAMHRRCIGKRCNICHDGEACTFCHRKQP